MHPLVFYGSSTFYFCTLCTNGLNWRYSGRRREKKGGIMEPSGNMEAGILGFRGGKFFAGEIE